LRKGVTSTTGNFPIPRRYGPSSLKSPTAPIVPDGE